MSMFANCPDCKKNFRVPHANRVWQCKSCGGDLDFVARPECPECGEGLEDKAAFCESCGHAISGSRKQANEAEAKVAATQMRKTRTQIKSLNLPLLLWLSMFFALAFLAVATFFAIDSYGTEGASRGLVIAGFAGVFCLANGLAIAKVKTNPFPVVLLLAVLRTLGTVLEFLSGSGSVDRLAIDTVYSVALWFLVVGAARLERLAREHPELYQAKLLHGDIERKGVDVSRSISKRGKTRSRERSRKSNVRLAGILAGVLALGTAGFFGLQAASAAPGPEPTLEAFRGAWNRADVPAVAAFFGEDRAAKWTSNVEKVQRKYSWAKTLPPLASFEITQQVENRIVVRFDGEGGALGTKFRFEHGHWRISALDLREVKTWRP